MTSEPGEPRSFARIAIALLAVLYAIQVFSPLRIDKDSSDYLSLAASLAQGQPLEQLGLPLGYPVLVAALDRLGIASPLTLVLINCLGVALGLVSTWYLFRSRAGDALWIVVFSLLSWTLVRHIALPLPESLFFGISLASVAAMNAAAGVQDSGRRVRILVVALLLTVIAITLRLAGIALVPAFVFACCTRTGRSQSELHRPNRLKWTIGLTVLLIAAISIGFLDDSFTKYFGEVEQKLLHLGGLGTFADHSRRITLTLGELVLNLPYGQLRNQQALFLIAGSALIVLVGAGLRHYLPRSPSDVYLVSFVTLLVLWPYDAPRLWLPVIPLLIGFMARSTPRFTNDGRWPRVGRVYLLWFAATGVAAIAYTTRVTFAGRNFSNVYGRAAGKPPAQRPRVALDSAYERRAAIALERYGGR